MWNLPIMPSRADWVLEYENLVILRTFSKAAGIAGLRLGYGICPAWLMAAVVEVQAAVQCQCRGHRGRLGQPAPC